MMLYFLLHALFSLCKFTALTLCRQVDHRPCVRESLYCRQLPPPTQEYPQWRHSDLKRAAREVISKDWPSAKHRAALLCSSTTQLAEVAAIKAQGWEEKAEDSEHAVRTLPGGEIGDGGDAHELPPMVLLTIVEYDSFPWTREEMRKRKWTMVRTANQLKLRNLSAAIARRSPRLTAEYRQRGLLSRGDRLRVSAPTAESVAALVRQALEAEEAAALADAAVAKANAAAETRERARARHGRRGRGVNAQNREAPQ